MIQIIDTAPERCLFQPRPRRAQRQPEAVGPIEAGWRKLQPYFAKPVKPRERPTLGTAKPFLPASFLAKEQDYEFLLRTQDMELETVAQELFRTGFESVALSRPDPTSEEEMLETNISTHRQPGWAPYETPDPALTARIEWERYVMACGQPVRVQLRIIDGQVAAESDPFTPARVVELLGQRLMKIVGRSAQQIDEGQAAAEHYGAVGSFLYGVFHASENDPTPTTNYDDLGASDQNKPEPGGAPVELGLHWLGYDAPDLGQQDFEVLPEPTAVELWPNDALGFAI